MKILQLSLALGMTVLFAAEAHAQAAAELEKTKGCLNCHAVDQTKMGPSFKAIAAKHKGEADAEAKLVAKLKNGTGHTKINATDAELQQLIADVLATQ